MAANLLVTSPDITAGLALATTASATSTKGGKLSLTLGSIAASAAATEVHGAVPTALFGLITIALAAQNVIRINCE
jgi:hypothetical protein